MAAAGQAATTIQLFYIRTLLDQLQDYIDHPPVMNPDGDAFSGLDRLNGLQSTVQQLTTWLNNWTDAIAADMGRVPGRI